MKRLGLAITLGAAVVAAAGIAIGSCSGGGTATTCQPGRAECRAGDPCTASVDCMVGLSCNQTTKKCEQVSVCTTDTQCATPSGGNPACTTAGKCICLEGKCQERGCSTDAVCAPGTVCSGGSCVPKPPATDLVCNILTPPSVIRQGQTLQFVAVAVNVNRAIVPGQTFSWSSSNTSAATIDPSGVATGGSTTGTTNITCTVTGGSTTASAPVALQNYANVGGGVRAVVIDAETGAPLSGAKVLFYRNNVLVETEKTTAADGTASIASTGAVDVHVFATGYTYTSIIGTSKADLLVPVLKTRDTSKAGGFRGTFDLSLVANQSDNVEFGLAGSSLTGSFIDLDFEKLIGESFRRRVKIGNLFDDFLGLPSGLVLKLGDQDIKGDYAALSQQGKRHAWAIGGKVPFDKLIQVLTPVLGGGTNVENLPFGQIIAQILPFFDKFRHFVKTDLDVVETARVPDTGDINGNGSTTDLVPDFNNTTAFKTVVAKVNQALSLSTSVTLPTLPQYGGKFLEGVILLAGANVIGRGLVPLGLSAGVDAPKQGETPDGQVDVDPNTAGNQSTLTFKMAPLHDGIEGSKFFFAALAISLRFGSGLPTSVSGIVTQTTSVDATTTLAASGFLGFPEGASFNLGNRQFSLGTPVSGAAIYRADFRGSDGDWVVYFKAPSGGGGTAFQLPATPSGATERAVGTCTVPEAGTQPCTGLRVFSLSTKSPTGGTAPTLDDVSEFGTLNLNRINDFVNAFSNAECQPGGSCAPPP